MVLLYKNNATIKVRVKI